MEFTILDLTKGEAFAAANCHAENWPIAASCGFFWNFPRSGTARKRKLPYSHTCAHFVCASHITVFGLTVLVVEVYGGNIISQRCDCEKHRRQRLQYSVETRRQHAEQRTTRGNTSCTALKSKAKEGQPGKCSRCISELKVRISTSHSQAWSSQHVVRKKPLCYAQTSIHGE